MKDSKMSVLQKLTLIGSAGVVVTTGTVVDTPVHAAVNDADTSNRKGSQQGLHEQKDPNSIPR